MLAQLDVSDAPHTGWISHSAARCGALTHLFVCGESSGFGQRCIERCMQSVAHTLAVNGAAGQAVLRVTVFAADRAAASCARECLAREPLLARAPTDIVIQPPASDAEVAVLVWTASGSDVVVDYPAPTVCRLRESAGTWLSIGSLEHDYRGSDPESAASRCWHDLADELRRHGASPSDLVRTWLYIGDLLAVNQGQQTYQLINRARRAFYVELDERGEPFPSGYPASTGIGACSPSVAIGALAFSPGSERAPAALENGNQTPASNYPASIAPIAPLFSRAVAMPATTDRMVLVSGTASIVDHRSVRVGDAAGQCTQTLDNIEELLGRGEYRLCYAIVYVKRPADLPAIRSTCAQRLPPTVPVVYTLADVCRDELLVEIECVAICREGAA